MDMITQTPISSSSIVPLTTNELYFVSGGNGDPARGSSAVTGAAGGAAIAAAARGAKKGAKVGAVLGPKGALGGAVVGAVLGATIHEIFD